MVITCLLFALGSNVVLCASSEWTWGHDTI